MFTIITCSIDDKNFEKFEKNVKLIFKNSYQLIRIGDARSIAEGYNRGIRRANGKFIVFCHDDIEFLNNNTAELIKNDLDKYDIVGVAGTSYLAGGSWITSGQPFTHGQVIHQNNNGQEGFTLNIYGLGRDNTIVTGIQALDGLFFAVNRNFLNRVEFDEASFDGFHFYDIDFTYSSYLKGARIIVDQRIYVLHFSGGNYDQVWKKYENRFRRKYPTIYPSNAKDNVNIIKWTCSQSIDKLIQEMHYNNEANRIDVRMVNEKQAGVTNLCFTSNRSNTLTTMEKYQKFPYSGDSINYARLELKLLSESVRDYLFTEMLRIGRHGAIVECVSNLPGKNNRCTEVKYGFISDKTWPKTIQFSKDGKVLNALMLMGKAIDNSLSSKAYYQINKKFVEQK